MKLWLCLLILALPLSSMACVTGDYGGPSGYEASSYPEHTPGWYRNPETEEEYRQRIWWENWETEWPHHFRRFP